MLFSLLRVSWTINIQKKWSDFENLFYCWYLVPIWDGLCKIFFFSSSIRTSDRYVQKIDRAMITFYNFCNFNILGIFQFKSNSPIVLLHILSQSTCLNKLILTEYKNKIFWLPQIYRVHPTHEHFGQLSKINIPNKCWSFPIKALKVTRNFVTFFL